MKNLSLTELNSATEVLEQYELDDRQRAMAERGIERRSLCAPFNAYTAANRAGSRASTFDEGFRARLSAAILDLIESADPDLPAPERVPGRPPMWNVLHCEYYEQTLAVRLIARPASVRGGNPEEPWLAWGWHRVDLPTPLSLPRFPTGWNPYSKESIGRIDEFIEMVLLPADAAGGELRAEIRPSVQPVVAPLAPSM